MNKNEILKLIKKLNKKTIDEYRKFFNDNKLIVVNNNWDIITIDDLEQFGNDADEFLNNYCIKSTAKLSKHDIADIIIDCNDFNFITNDDIKKFKDEIYPKAYAEYMKSSKTSEKSSKEQIHNRINTLRQELDRLESALHQEQ